MSARLSLGTHLAAAERREEARQQEASSRGGNNNSLEVHSLEDDYLWGRNAGEGIKRSVARLTGIHSPRSSSAQDVLPEKINPTRKNQSLRKRVRLGLLVSKTNLYLAIVQVIISFLFIVSWVIGTYFEDDLSIRFILFYIDVSFASVLTLYFFFDLFLAEKRGRYLIAWSSWIDYITIIPTFVPPDAKVLDSNLGFRFLAGLATFRIFRLYRALKFPISEIKQKILTIGFSVLCIVFVATGLLYEVELEYNDTIQQWQNALYMVVVTVATVGYGDVSPVTELGRVLLMLLIIVTFILIPIQTSSLLGLLSQISVYDGSYKPNDAIHLIVTGFVTESKLRQFLNELFSETWVKAAIDLVILGPDKPSPAMKSLIRNAVPEGKRVTYLRGNPLVEEDLIRAAAHKAHAVFVFCNKYANSAEEDKSVILQAIAAKRFSSSLEIFVQIINPESKVQLRREGITNIVCMKELNFSLIGANVLFPGMSTFLNDLISLAKLQQKNYQGRWQEDYTKSKEHGIFRMRLPECFVGKRFDEAAEAIYYEYNAIMFAIRRENDIMELFPYSTTLVSTDSVFIILDSYNAADNIAECQTFPEIDIGEVKRLTHDYEDAYPDAVKKSTSADWKRALSIVLDRTGEQLDKSTPRTLVRRKATALLSVAPTTMKAVEMDSLTAPTASDIKVITASATLTASGNLEGVKERNSLLKEPLVDSNGPLRRRLSQSELKAETAAQAQALNKAESFQNAFHLSPAPRNFNSAYRFSVEFEESIERHLIICASTLEGLFYLIGPLRFKRLPKIQQIVILIPELPADYLAHWVQIGIFPEVYVIEGSPMIQLDLKHAGISKADKILILKSGEDKTSATEDSNVVDRFTSDSDAILSYFTVTEQNAIRELLLQKARVIVELGNEESVRFFHEKGQGSKLLSELETKFTQGKYSLLSAPFGSGRVVLGSTFESLTAKLFFNTDIIIALKLMLSYEKSTPSCVIQIPMPQEFIAKLKKRQRTFKDFFRWAVRKKVLLPLGLYRCAGTHGATEGYVHTCPSHNTVLQEQDRFFVVCRKSDLNEYLAEMPGVTYDPVQEANSQSKSKRKFHRSDLYSPRTQETDSEFNVEEVNMIVNGIKNELSSQAERISNLEEKLSLILEAVTAGNKKDKAKKKEKKINKEQRRNSDKKKSRRSSAKSNYSTTEKSTNVPTPVSSMKTVHEIPEVVVVPPTPKKIEKQQSISIEESHSSSSDSDE